MKNIFFLALLVLGACHKDSPEPVYKSSDGKWSFTGTHVQGEMVISGGAVTSGYYKIDGVRYDIKIPTDYILPQWIVLVSKYSPDDVLVFTGASFSSDWKTLVALGYYTIEKDIQKDGSGTVTFKRE